jgi:3-oxoadipate enol-lactonase
LAPRSWFGSGVVSVAYVNGAELWYELQGTGRPLVLLHAGGTDSRMWDEQFAALAERFRVLRFDARGYGRSSLPAGPSSFVDDLVALMDVVGIDAAALVGLSFGARVALEAALTHPRRPFALVLASPTLRDRPRSQAIRRFAVQEDELVGRGEVDAAIELGHRFWLAGPQRPLEDIDPRLRDRLAAMERQAYAKYLAAEPKPAPEIPPPDHEFDRITVPTLVVVGELDVADVLATATRLQGEIAMARKVVFADAGHIVSMERPSEFTELITEFLTASRAGAEHP